MQAAQELGTIAAMLGQFDIASKCEQITGNPWGAFDRAVLANDFKGLEAVYPCAEAHNSGTELGNSNWGESDSEDDLIAASCSEELTAAGDLVWKLLEKTKDNGKLKNWKTNSHDMLATRQWPGFGSVWATPKDTVPCSSVNAR